MPYQGKPFYAQCLKGINKIKNEVGEYFAQTKCV